MSLPGRTPGRETGTDAADAGWRALLRAAPVAVAATEGPTHRFVFASERYETLVGSRVLVGRNYSEALPEVAAHGVADIFDLVYATGTPRFETAFRTERDWRGLGLEERYFDFAVEPRRGLQGEILGLMMVVIETTANVHAQRTSERSAQRSARLLAVINRLVEARAPDEVGEIALAEAVPALGASAGSLALSSEDGATLEIRHMLGYSAQTRAAYPRIAVTESLPFAEAARTGRSIYVGSAEEFQARYPNIGDTLSRFGHHAWAAAPLRVEARVIGVLALSFPISRQFDDDDRAYVDAFAAQIAGALERARLHAAERTLRAAAEASNRLKDEFLATLSHELRAPLNAILGWSRLARDSRANPSVQARAWEVIERNAQNQARLVDDLLDVSRFVFGAPELTLRPVDLETLVHAAVESIRPRADEKKVTLRVPQVREPVFVEGDAQRLAQVVTNLLSNAIKFTPSEGTVWVELGLDTDTAVLRVRDTGQGIVPWFIPHVFERFRQADGSATRAHGGLGLGLAIVKQFVERHRGTVTAESEGAGRGATFTVRLPRILGP